MNRLPRSKKVDDENGTAAFAARLYPLLKKGDVVILQGGLAAGKTAFARALVRQATQNPAEDVPSPTFTLVQVYETKDFELWHIDLYRLENPEQEILELGWDELRRHGVAVIEWGERLGRLLPDNRLEIRIENIPNDPTARVITCVPFGDWGGRISDDAD